MFESGKTTPVIKKSYEIAYALCRIAMKIPEKRFSDALSDEAVKSLGSITEGEYGKAERTLAATEYLIKLGTGIGSVDFMNGEVLLGEIAILNGMIAELLNVSKVEPADLSGIFTSVDVQAEDSRSNIEAYPSGHHFSSEPENAGFRHYPFTDNSDIIRQEENVRNEYGNIPATNSGNPAISPAESGNQNSPEIIELIKSGNRHGAILEKIRQSGNCRIKDIHDLFPECSERTIRYDLQSLTEQNLIEKIGTGGPAVFYRNKE